MSKILSQMPGAKTWYFASAVAVVTVLRGLLVLSQDALFVAFGILTGAFFLIALAIELKVPGRSALAAISFAVISSVVAFFVTNNGLYLALGGGMLVLTAVAIVVFVYVYICLVAYVIVAVGAALFGVQPPKFSEVLLVPLRSKNY